MGLLKFIKKKLLEIPKILVYPRLLFDRYFLKKNLLLTDLENQALSVEKAILNSEAFSTRAQTSYQTVAVSEISTDTSFSLYEEKQKLDSRTSAASTSPVKDNCFLV